MAGAAATTFAATCNVPSAPFATINSALANPTCTTILVAGGTYVESLDITRDVAIQGMGWKASLVSGMVRASGAGVDVSLSEIAIDARGVPAARCASPAIDSRLGARVVTGRNVDVRGRGVPSADCELSKDGFETGNLAGWTVMP